MVESAENGSTPNGVTRRNTVSMAAYRDGRMQPSGYSRTQTHVWSRVIEMRNPGLHFLLHVKSVSHVTASP